MTVRVHPIAVPFGKAQTAARPSLIATQQVTSRALTQKNCSLETTAQPLHHRKIGRFDHFERQKRMVYVKRSPHVICVVPSLCAKIRRPDEILHHMLARHPWTLVKDVKPLGINELMQEDLRRDQ